MELNRAHYTAKHRESLKMKIHLTKDPHKNAMGLFTSHTTSSKQKQKPPWQSNEKLFSNSI